MINYIKLARPRQYTKNLFILLPALFAFKLTDLHTVWSALIAFISFSFLASAVYVLNDWIDRFDDAQHPVKCMRPIASGKIQATSAFLFMLFLFLGGVTLGLSLSVSVFMLLITYFCLNLAYTFKLKHVALIDILIIAIGFVIRLFVGAEATEIVLSHWIVLMSFLLALFLSLAKRRDDVLIYIKTSKKMRRVIDGYNLKFLDSSMNVTASVIIVAYMMWSISDEVVQRMNNENLYLSSFFVIVGVLRYLQIALVDENSGAPEKILTKDWIIMMSVLGWGLVIFVAGQLKN